MECEPKMENLGSPDRDGGADRDGGGEGNEGMADCEGLKGGAEETEDSKKRKRKPYRPGQLRQQLLPNTTTSMSEHPQNN